MNEQRESFENFAFVLNIFRLYENDEHILAPGSRLRKATLPEVNIIKQTLRNSVTQFHAKTSSLWESRLPFKDGPIEVLSPEDWRYFVIGFKGYNDTIVNLTHVFDIAPLELEIGFTFLYNPGVLFNPGRLFQVIEQMVVSQKSFMKVTNTRIEEIKRIYELLQMHDSDLTDIKSICQQMGELKTIPYKSPLRFLGYFGILESLLTHAPKPGDPYDSITRQVRKKVTLLNNRFDTPIDYSPFGETLPDTIWSKMYAYRSRLAHGDNPSVTEEFTILNNKENVLELIKETTKAIIRQALIEPRLLADLRNC